MHLDVGFVRSQFPAFDQASLRGWSFFESAGGSFPCRQTIDALTRYYTETRVQPYAPYPASQAAGAAMDHSRQRWAEALGVGPDEVSFGPSTSMNAYVLANAFGQVLGPGDEVVVTNQDHEANTGAIRRAAKGAGATLVEWAVDPERGLLDLERLADLLTARTRLVVVPHCSNIVGMENDVVAIVAMAHERGARVVVDGVSYAPHGFPDVAALDADVYLFSLYKTYSVHQGLMVTRNGILDELPNQGHYFNRHLRSKRLTPAGPDHAQEAAAGAVLDYVEALAHHHGDRDACAGLRAAVDATTERWQHHETRLLGGVLDLLDGSSQVRLVGPDRAGSPTGVDGRRLHRCPTVAFVPLAASPVETVDALVRRGVMCWSGDFYAARLIEALGIDPDTGVVRVSWVHYTSDADIDRLLAALAEVVV
jgi:selenocysteine lyase/cysteine desulfurase